MKALHFVVEFLTHLIFLIQVSTFIPKSCTMVRKRKIYWDKKRKSMIRSESRESLTIWKVREMKRIVELKRDGTKTILRNIVQLIIKQLIFNDLMSANQWVLSEWDLIQINILILKRKVIKNTYKFSFVSHLPTAIFSTGNICADSNERCVNNAIRPTNSIRFADILALKPIYNHLFSNLHAL